MLQRLLHASITLIIYLTVTTQAHSQDITFWDQTRTGTNAFNKNQTEQWFKDSNTLGVSWIRLTFDKWSSNQKDFLVGDADNYKGLVVEDLAKLRKALDSAHLNGLKVVLTPLTLPGARYSQNNGFKYDSRLWTDPTFAVQANQYWHDLAKEFSGHPAIVGYNIINEPAPELHTGVAEHGSPGDTSRFDLFYSENKGSPADLFLFYKNIISTIREVDQTTPIMVDAGWYAQPSAFTYWPGPLDDKNILYSFHVYEPYAFTSFENFKKNKKLTYPGDVAFSDRVFSWNKELLEEYLQPFYSWADKNNIPQNRLVAGEFGCYRRNEGCSQYLTDVISLLEKNNTHWAFYSFREDEWDGYDYEVGTKALPWKYWKEIEKGEKPEIPRDNTKIFKAIKSRLK